MARMVRYRQSLQVSGEFVLPVEVLETQAPLVLKELKDADPFLQPVRIGFFTRTIACIAYPVLWLLHGRKWHPGVFNETMFGKPSASAALRWAEKEKRLRDFAAHVRNAPANEVKVMGDESGLDDELILQLISQNYCPHAYCLDCGGKEVLQSSLENAGYDHGPLAQSCQPMFRCPQGHVLFKTQLWES